MPTNLLSSPVELRALICHSIPSSVSRNHQPDPNWFRAHVLNWSSDIGILGLVRDLTEFVAVLAFGVGLVFGFTFDTSGPAAYGSFGRRRRAAAVPAGGAAPPPVEDQPTAREEREIESESQTEPAQEREPARTE